VGNFNIDVIVSVYWVKRLKTNNLYTVKYHIMQNIIYLNRFFESK